VYIPKAGTFYSEQRQNCVIFHARMTSEKQAQVTRVKLTDEQTVVVNAHAYFF
jgi:hypothetical protein